MIGPNDYPVYNSRERPGIGRDHSGRMYFNCFSIRLKQADDAPGSYEPYLFSDFVRQYAEYPDHALVCDSCISEHRVFTFPADRSRVDRSAPERKFCDGDEGVDESDYYYCPLVREILAASDLLPEPALRRDAPLPAKPIWAILAANWDDEYLFELQRIGRPDNLSVCAIHREMFSPRFASTPAERSFLTMWVLSMLRGMELARQSGRRAFLEEVDFDQSHSKLFSFTYPVPQVWVQVIPKPAPRPDWKHWQQSVPNAGHPQRVDFLFTHAGRRHIIELDDVGHYGVQSGEGGWAASERRYRKTLEGSRLLRRSGFALHRFANGEILELYDPDSAGEPNLNGFMGLLRSESLEPADMVFPELGAPIAEAAERPCHPGNGARDI